MRVAIIGRTEILYEIMERLTEAGHDISLIITAKEAVEYKKTANDFKYYAEENNIPFLHTANIAASVDEIVRHGAIDIGVSLNYAGIIPQNVIDCFRLGILNAHGGDLPRYRGNACQAWAILNAEEKIGLCIHRMIGDELDSGDIVAREYLPINIDTKVTQAWEWMAQKIPDLFLESLNRLSVDPDYIVEKQSKDPALALRCYPRRPEDGEIKWQESAEKILRLINASNRPYSGAFCDFEGKKVIIWDAVLAEKENFLAVPGQVTEIGNGYIEVATGEQKIKITEIEYDEKIMAPSDLIKSIRKRLS